MLSENIPTNVEVKGTIIDVESKIKKSLGSEHPELISDWSKKNGNLSPFDIAPKSNRYAYWVCKKGHEWKAKVYNRSLLKTGCPYCSGLKLLPENCLKNNSETLSKEWHPIKNGSLQPENVSFKSNKYAWWICKEGHEWKAKINNRANGRGCPYCANRYISQDNNLKIKFPEIAKEWNYEKNQFGPEEVVYGSYKKVWWRCKYGHEWEAKISKRTKGNGCPRCSNQTSKIEIRIYCELKTIFPRSTWRKKYFEHELDIYIPEIRTGIEVDGYPWHINSGNRDNSKTRKLHRHNINLIRVRDERLPDVEGRIIPFNKNCSDIQIVVDILTMLSPTREIKFKKAIDSYIFNNQIENDSEYKKILSYLPGPSEKESLNFLFPDVSAEWNHSRNHPLKPTMFYPSSNQKVWWKCVKGHEWKAVIASRKFCGCPYCSGNLPSVDHNFATLFPDFLSEWDYEKNKKIDPFKLTPKSHTKVWWKCSSGHGWKTTIHHRTGKKRGCPYCSNQRIIKENSLAARFPEIVKEWNHQKNKNLDPNEIAPGTKKKVWWICNAGHEWEASVCGRTGRGRGCPYCAGQRPTNTNNLSVKYPDIARQWIADRNNPLTPNLVLPKSDKKVWWICDSGHEWKAPIKDRTRGNGCPYCSGRSPTKERTLAYVHPRLIDEWHPIKNGDKTPFDFSTGSSKKVWWICNKGHEWEAVISSRSKGHGCKYCYKEKHRK